MSHTHGLIIRDDTGKTIYSTENATWLLLDNFILGSEEFYSKDYSYLTDFSEVSVQMQMLGNAPDNQEGYTPELTIDRMNVNISPLVDENRPISTTELIISNIYFIPDNPEDIEYSSTYLWTGNKNGKYLGTYNFYGVETPYYEQIKVYEYKNILPRYTDIPSGTIVIPGYSYTGWIYPAGYTNITVPEKRIRVSAPTTYYRYQTIPYDTAPTTITTTNGYTAPVDTVVTPAPSANTSFNFNIPNNAWYIEPSSDLVYYKTSYQSEATVVSVMIR